MGITFSNTGPHQYILQILSGKTSLYNNKKKRLKLVCIKIKTFEKNLSLNS